MSGDCISKSQNSNEIRKEVKNGKDHDAFSLLRKQRLDYPKNVIFGHLNINSLRNKFESISELIKGNFDIFLINETKLDASFPSNQFAMSGYKFVRKDRNKFLIIEDYLKFLMNILSILNFRSKTKYHFYYYKSS